VVKKRLKVKNDFIFQKIFGQNEHKDILISFLNAVLELEDKEKLNDIEILENTKLKRDGPDDKLGILDLRAKTLAGEQINIEIQLVNKYDMGKRTLFYWSKMFTEQLREGQPYSELMKTITINILDFNYTNVDSYNTVFHLWEDRHKDYKLTDALEIRFIELPKFRKAKYDLSRPLDRWLVFIDDSPEEVLKMAMKAEPVIAKAEEILEYLGSLDEVKRYYEAREKEIHDEATRITGAKEEGRKEERLEIVKGMLGEGLPIEQIIRITGISADEIEKLKKEF
jgi:predicted transposase/invertase (TIGR01784 family)